MSVPSTLIFASVNRREMLHESVSNALEQSVPIRVIVVVPSNDHVLPQTLALPGVELLIAPRGSCSQRNAALRRLSSKDGVVFFFDDDVEIERRYVETMLRLFDEDSEVVLAAGVNVGTGAKPGTLTRSIAKALIVSRLANPAPGMRVQPVRGVAACKMAMRASLLGQVEFDERLPLYGYLEDLDFTLRCSKFGKIVECKECLMVHIEAAAGRVGRRKRGYSEVVNPIYIYRKKIGASAFRIIGGAIKRTLLNLLRLSSQAGRDQLLGNIVGWWRVLSGRGDPEYVIEINDLEP